MRRILALLLIAFVLLPLTTPYAKALDEVQPIVHSLREVEIMNAGLLNMNDVFTLEAPQGAQVQVTSLRVGFHASFTAERRSFHIWEDGDWQLLEYEESDLGDPRFYGFKVSLPSPVVLEGGRTLKIRASHLFVNRVSWSVAGYVARIPVYPATPYNISSFLLQVTMPEDAELKEVDSLLAFTNSSEGGIWTLTHKAETLMPLLNDNVTITYDPAPEDEYLLDCEFVKQGISILPGKLRLEDAYVIINRASAISRFHLKLPPGSSNVEAYDGVGALEVEHYVVEDDGGYVDLYVSPRSPTAQWNRWSFTVKYSIPRREYLEGDGGRFTLTYPATEFPHYIRRLVVVATLPEGGSFSASDPEPTSVKKTTAFTQQALIDFGSVTPTERPDVALEYSRSVLWYAFRPLEWVLLAAGVVLGVYVLRRRRRFIEEKPVEAKRPDLEDFLDLYGKRLALLAEQEELERGVERKEIGREQFDRRSTEITRRQRELLQRLRGLMGRLEAADPRMSERIREIKRAEAELERVETDLMNLEVRLRTRRVSRRDYERRRRDYRRRRRRSRRRIEQAIAMLKAEA